MSENFRKMQIASLKNTTKVNKSLEKVGQNYKNNDSAKLREKQDFEKMQKRLQLILEGIGIEELANLDIDFMIYGADENTNLSPETREFIKLSKQFEKLITHLYCQKILTKARKDTIIELEGKFDKLENETKIWLNSGSGDKFILDKAVEERESEKLLLEKLDRFLIICNKLGISAGEMFSLLEKYYLTDIE